MMLLRILLEVVLISGIYLISLMGKSYVYYMADKEKKIPLGAYPEPVEIANNLARYIEVKDV